MKILKKLVPKDYFVLHYNIHKAIGLLPPKQKRLKLIYQILYFPIITNSLILVTQELINLIILFYDDLKATLMMVSLVLMHSIGMIRTSSWYLIKYKVFAFTNILNRESFRLNAFNIETLTPIKGKKELSYGQLKKLWINVAVKKRLAKRIRRTSLDEYREQYMFYTHAFTTAYLWLMLLSVFFIFAIAFSKPGGLETKETFNPYKNKTSTVKDFPFPIYFPFDVSISDGHYWPAYFFQLYSLLILVTHLILVDNYTVSAIIHIRSQMNIVSKSLDYVDKDNKNEFMLKIKLFECVSQTQQLMRAVEMFEELFSGPFSLQFLFITVIYCTMIYFVSVADTTRELIIGLETIVIIFMEPLIIVWYSHSLTEEV